MFCWRKSKSALGIWKLEVISRIGSIPSDCLTDLMGLASLAVFETVVFRSIFPDGMPKSIAAFFKTSPSSIEADQGFLPLVKITLSAFLCWIAFKPAKKTVWVWPVNNNVVFDYFCRNTSIQDYYRLASGNILITSCIRQRWCMFPTARRCHQASTSLPADHIWYSSLRNLR